MTLILPNEVAERYEALFSMTWLTDYKENLSPILSDSTVKVVSRGCLTTDHNGLAISQYGVDSAVFMASNLNHVWQLWLKPEVERYKKEDIEIPNEITSLLFVYEKDRMNLTFNYEFMGNVIVKPLVNINKGDPLSFDKIIDFVDMSLPEIDGKATNYYLVRFNGKQISIVFDFTPGQELAPFNWTEQHKKWFGSAFAEQALAYVYGHVYPQIPSLTTSNTPFCIGIVSRKMVEITKASEKGVAAVDDYLKNNMEIDDWNVLVQSWVQSESWKKRAGLFQTALSCYEYALYTATICVLIPQIEGIIMEYLVAHGKGLRSSGHAKPWGSARKVGTVLFELRELFNSQNFGVIRQTVADTLLHFLEHSSLYSNFSWRDGGALLGRHAILHGYQVEFGDKCNADRLFMVLDSLFNLIGREFKFNKEQQI